MISDLIDFPVGSLFLCRFQCPIFLPADTQSIGRKVRGNKPLRRNIGSSRSLKQCYVVLMSGFDTQIYVTLHGFRSLGRACILLKTFVGIMFQFRFLESQDHWLWEKFLYILITFCTVCTRVYCSVTLNSNSKKTQTCSKVSSFIAFDKQTSDSWKSELCRQTVIHTIKKRKT